MSGVQQGGWNTGDFNPRPGIEIPFRRLCPKWVDVNPGDQWAGTLCKLTVNHDGPCSPIYPDGTR
jgi:hypothetical protein